MKRSYRTYLVVACVVLMPLLITGHKHRFFRFDQARIGTSSPDSQVKESNDQGAVRQLSWDDLVPAEQLPSLDLLEQLSEEELALAGWVYTQLEALPERGPETEEFYRKFDEAIETLKKAGLDILEFAEAWKRSETATVDDLNGRTVRLPGYVLPLDANEGGITEFLLVPYVGACIHTPPPPPNQIVHVTVDGKKGYKSKGLYDPVWVTGSLSVTSLSKELFLSDGTADISVGYSMLASLIEEYRD